MKPPPPATSTVWRPLTPLPPGKCVIVILNALSLLAVRDVTKQRFKAFAHSPHVESALGVTASRGSHPVPRSGRRQQTVQRGRSRIGVPWGHHDAGLRRIDHVG